MARWTRRQFAQTVLRTLGPLALVRELRARDALGAPARYFIDLVDPSGAEKLTDGTLRARRIGWEESLRLYPGRA